MALPGQKRRTHILTARPLWIQDQHDWIWLGDKFLTRNTSVIHKLIIGQLVARRFGNIRKSEWHAPLKINSFWRSLTIIIVKHVSGNNACSTRWWNHNFERITFPSNTKYWRRPCFEWSRDIQITLSERLSLPLIIVQPAMSLESKDNYGNRDPRSPPLVLPALLPSWLKPERGLPRLPLPYAIDLRGIKGVLYRVKKTVFNARNTLQQHSWLQYSQRRTPYSLSSRRSLTILFSRRCRRWRQLTRTTFDDCLQPEV